MSDKKPTYEELGKQVAKLINNENCDFEHFQNIVGTNLIGFTVTDEKGFLYVNSKFLDMLGYKSFEELNNKQWSDLIHENDIENILKRASDIKQGKNVQSAFEAKFVCRNESVKTFIVENREGEHNGSLCMFSTFIDITESKKAEVKLKESKDRFESYFNNPVIGIAITSIQKGWLEVNERLCSMLGYTKEELYGMTWSELTYPDDLEIDLEQFNRVCSGEIESYSLEKRFISKNEKVIWTEMGVSCRRKDNGEIDYFVATLNDISEGKKSQQKLKDSEGKFRHLYETMTQGVVIQDDKGEIIEANQAACDILGISMDQMLGKTPYDPRWKLIREDGSRYDPSEMPSNIALDTGKQVKDVLCGVYVPEKDEYRWIMIGSSPQFKDGESKPDLTMTVFTDITERKKAENTLIETKNKFEGMIDGLGRNYCLYSHTKEGVFTYVSSGFESVFGIKPKDAVGLNWRDLNLTDQSIDEGVKFDSKLLNGDSPYEVVRLEYKHPDGSFRLIEVGGRKTTDPDGSEHIEGICHDITDHKKAEEALRASEQRYIFINDASFDQIYSYDLDNRFTSANRHLCEGLGLNAHEIIGKTYWELGFPESNCRDWDELHRQVYANGSKVEVVATPMPDGTTHYFEVNLTLIHNDVGEVIGIAGVNRDITERIIAENALKLSEEKYRTLFESMNEGIVFHEMVYNSDGVPVDYKILDGNQTFENITGLKLDDIVGKLASEAYQTDKPPYLEIYAKVADTGVNKTFDAYSPPMDKHLRISVLSQEKGKFTTVFIDITKQKNAEAMESIYHEQEKHAVVGKVAGKMAHDFNNVLGIIMGTSQLLQTEDLPDSVSREIDIIIDSAKRGKELTRNLLIFAKDQETKLSKFNLNDKINMLLQSLKTDLKNIKVAVNYDDNMSDMLADVGLMENALINLIQNSIHAMSKTVNPHLKISTYRDEDNICIEIEDNGCGIPDEYKDKIFEPTVTLKGSRDKYGVYSKDIKGSGYGLANVKRCIDKHGGKIEFESEEGKGTTFKLICKVIDADLSPQEIETIEKQEIVKGKRILIVEDEPHFGRILYSLLGKFDHNVALATDGEMAIDHFNKNVYDAISLDFVLPDMTGMDVYRKIRETNKDIPIIFVSGNFEFMQSMVNLKKEDPNVDHLPKPFDNVEYVNKINEWLQED